METIKADVQQIAFCGLYCGSCKKFLAEKCPGCAGNEKASWCGIRKCCLEHNYKSCADCREFSEINDCPKFNNFISRAIGFVLRSNRRACIEQIQKNGYEKFAQEMADKRIITIKK